VVLLLIFSHAASCVSESAVVGGMFRLQGAQIIGGLLGMARGGKDRALVVFEGFEP
jgi:hypothetical protein